MESGNAGLFTGFEGYRSPTREALQRAVRESLVVLDTNVLLNLYNFQGTALDDFTRVFAALKDRLFVPHQVVDEFWRNRRTVLEQNQGRHREQEEIEKAFSLIETQFSKWYQRVVDRIGKPSAEALRELSEANEAVLSFMTKHNNAAQFPRPDTPTHDDRILQRLEPILSGHVGPAPSDAERHSLMGEGKRRIGERRPPGYMDGEKNPERAVGDFLVWRQAMDASAQRDLPLLVVTQDQKEDWWADRGTESMRARPELVSELLSVSGHELLMIRAHELVGLSDQLGVTVSESTIKASQSASSDESSGWTSELAGHYIDILSAGWPAQYKIFCEAVESGGEIKRAKIARILKKRVSDSMTGMGKPYYTALRRLVSQGYADEEPEVPLAAYYEVGGVMTSFVMPEGLAPVFEPALYPENPADEG